MCNDLPEVTVDVYLFWLNCRSGSTENDWCMRAESWSNRFGAATIRRSGLWLWISLRAIRCTMQTITFILLWYYIGHCEVSLLFMQRSSVRAPRNWRACRNDISASPTSILKRVCGFWKLPVGQRLPRRRLGRHLNFNASPQNCCKTLHHFRYRIPPGKEVEHPPSRWGVINDKPEKVSGSCVYFVRLSSRWL
jgi:hypothetical protein